MKWEDLLGFAKDEDGNVTVFSVFMLVLILMITGASVDIMRFEAVRTKMQSTLDRAVLAAADLDQQQDPQDVVADYMAKAGLADGLTSDAVVDEGINYRTVTAEGQVELDTIFLHMSGFNQLTAPGISTAEEKISNVEISVVLDVSGSMGGDRIVNMRAAAKEFVDTVIQPADSPGLTTVSLVPYNAVVNIGSTLAPYFTWDEVHDYSHCAIFDDSDFNSVGMDTSSALERLAHFDLYSSSESTTQIANPWCPTGDTSAMVVHSDNATALKAHVDSLQAGGNTAIDMGMKWATALLDDSLADVVGNLAADGIAASGASSRPAAYSDPEAIKFVVVMTDGENTSQYDLEPEYKYGWSDVWIDERGNTNASDDRFSVRVRDLSGTSNDVYFWTRYENSSWSYRYDDDPDGGSSARQMTNAEVFARFGTKGAANKFLYQPYRDGWVSYSVYRDMYYGYESIVNGSSADERLSDICAAARDEGIVIFAIAFEAPTGGQEALQDCASSPSHYFDVEGVEITETFHAIARQINSLRLVQ
ncbi:VWA domain-containing protein [Thalassococcus lentus]|uniref:VWA domain-containing protein n=1 Tax=Thalassococcus lentus TaxID=1210524 RepID=A0ABT4XVV0_9RHOB|nr:VWA domain-containing protein [Thalassococcus lentus]MDA7426090.1 VWA domain-containing protein [Thalassococcus lentus]